MDRYSSIKYKVHLATGPLDKAFPELFKHKEFAKLKTRRDCDQLVRFIMFLYDKNTQLIHEYQTDLKERKFAAAKDAGYYQKAGGGWGAEIQAVMDIQDHDATAAIMQFLKMQKHNVWTEIVVCEQELFDYQVMRFTPVGKRGKKSTAEDEKKIIESTVKKEALRKACNERIVALESLYEQFFGDNKDLIAAEFEEAIKPETAERIILADKPYEEIKESQNVLSNS